VFAASRLAGSADSLVAWTRAIEELKKGPFVSAIRRFSNPPVPQDLDGLRLDDADLDALRVCRPGRCDVMLARGEIESLRAAAAMGGEAWSEAVQHEFRRLVLERVNVYRAEGLAALAPYEHRSAPISPRDAFASIVAHSPYLSHGPPELLAALGGFSEADAAGSESFLYWSKERYGTAKPVIAVTHVTIVRPEATAALAVVVLGKEIFATHYRNASLGMTAVVRDPARNVSYLVYVNRSHIDVLGGVFSGLKRMLIEGRIRSESATLLTRVRDRIEGGDPSP